MNAKEINLQSDAKGGKAFIGEATDTKAEMTYSQTGDQLIIIDHTWVDDSLRGQGVGRKLLDKLVHHAREKEWKVIPLCPYAKSVFQKDEEIRDVLK